MRPTRGAPWPNPTPYGALAVAGVRNRQRRHFYVLTFLLSYFAIILIIKKTLPYGARMVITYVGKYPIG